MTAIGAPVTDNAVASNVLFKASVQL